MSSGADKNGMPSEVMAAIAELKLELSKQIRDSFSSLEARIVALEERPSNLDERIKKLEDQSGYSGILGSFQSQSGTTAPMREVPLSEAKGETWNMSAPETIFPAPLPMGTFHRAGALAFSNHGTTSFGKSMPAGTASFPFISKQVPPRVAVPQIPATTTHGGDTAGVPRYHKLDFPTYDGKDDPLGWLNRCEQFFWGQRTDEGYKVWLAAYYMVDDKVDDENEPP